jgi:ubiquinone/menaquinone biosynthesis C-methylase UbiE
LEKVATKRLKILDIGSGTGGLTKYLYKYGDIIGLEKDKYAFELSKSRGVNIVNGNAENLPFDSGSFNLVTILDVLYHKNVKYEGKVLAETWRVLKKNGYLLITDSALNFLKSKHDIFTQGKRRYSLREMATLVEKHNFKVIKASYLFFSIFPAILISRLILNKFKTIKNSDVNQVSPILNYLLIIILKTEAFLLRHISFPYGSSVIILAEKI